MSAHPWPPGRFYASIAGVGPVEQSGYVWRGLGLRHSGWRRPRTLTRWILTHVGSGGKILEMTGDVDTVFPIATEIAGCSDFTLFDLPDGWRQTDPDMPLKINAIICDAHGGAVFTSKAPHFVISDDNARAVIAARESAEQSAK